MNIYLLDFNKKMTDRWEKDFKDTDVLIENNSFHEFMKDKKEIDGIISPGNSFGLMDGGYDLAITKYFGNDLMNRVQEKIIREWKGEQPIGVAMSVPIDRKRILIHVPSMRVPQEITDYQTVYQCTRVAIIEAQRNNLKNIVIPAFGAGYGKVPEKMVSKMMLLAYEQIYFEEKEISWDYATKIHRKIIKEII